MIGDKDWPSKTVLGGLRNIEKAKNHATIEMLPQVETNTGVGGHYFMQQDYQDRIEKIVKEEIVGRYEIY